MPSPKRQAGPQQVATLAKTARENTVSAARTSTIGESEPLYDVYHYGFSICSNKVRAVLFELGIPWLSLELDPSKHENYQADYVRLRLASELAEKASFATGWEGGSSVEENGFAALVVPTLFDRDHSSVVVDSLAICIYLATRHREQSDLFPDSLQPDIERQLEAVDKTPHVALLYGPNPEGPDRRAFVFRQVFKGEHLKKAKVAESEAKKIAGEDPRLDEAYAAKIAKEKAGSAFVADQEKMRDALTKTKVALAQLGDDLESAPGPWLCGDRYTLADLFWGVSLFRLEYLGYGWLLHEAAKPEALQTYAERAISRPSVIASVAKWPSQPWSKPAAKWMRSPSIKDRLMGWGS